jgi:glycosyltransferase involved in cell wall biosynthesis
MQADRDINPSTNAPMLSVVIPALNEEEAIGDTLRRCVAAREQIVRRGVARDVEFIVVSDGSTDRTEEIACSFASATVLAFTVNRGYGAAIKCGFEYARGELVGFIDADGTCDPAFFEQLVAAMQQQGADLVLGSRMGGGSKMPWLRAVGNRLFAWMLSALSMQSVADTASGMRVIRRSALAYLYPLPDGLHFTPAMSARALLEGRLKLIEVPMPYAERTGRSKLHVLRDGVRFLSSIIAAAVTFRPARPLLIIAGVFAFAAFLSGLYPAMFYVEHLRLEEWVIYRVLLSSLLATIATLVLCAAVIADRIAAAAHGRWASRGEDSALHRLFAPGMRTLTQALLTVAAFAFTAPGIVQYIETRHVDMHWSRAVLGSLLVLIAAMLGITGFLLRMMDYIEVARDNRASMRPPDRLRVGVAGAVKETL